jgi:hypothetical protein
MTFPRVGALLCATAADPRPVLKVPAYPNKALPTPAFTRSLLFPRRLAAG